MKSLYDFINIYFTMSLTLNKVLINLTHLYPPPYLLCSDWYSINGFDHLFMYPM